MRQAVVLPRVVRPLDAARMMTQRRAILRINLERHRDLIRFYADLDTTPRKNLVNALSEYVTMWMLYRDRREFQNDLATITARTQDEDGTIVVAIDDRANVRELVREMMDKPL